MVSVNHVRLRSLAKNLLVLQHRTLPIVGKTLAESHQLLQAYLSSGPLFARAVQAVGETSEYDEQLYNGLIQQSVRTFGLMKETTTTQKRFICLFDYYPLPVYNASSLTLYLCIIQYHPLTSLQIWVVAAYIMKLTCHYLTCMKIQKGQL